LRSGKIGGSETKRIDMVSRDSPRIGGVGLLALAILAAAGVARADWRDDITVFRVGVMTGANAPYRLAQLQPFKNYLESRIALPVEIVPSADFNALIAAQTGLLVDYAIESATAFVTARARCDCVEALAVPTRSGGEAGFYALLVAAAAGPIKTLADAKGTRLALAAEDSVGGRLLQMQAFEAEEIDAGEFFSEVVDVHDPEAAITALLAGRADLAVAWSSLVGDRAAGYSFGVLADLVAEGGLAMDQIEIVWQSALIPFGPHVIRSNLPDELKQLLSRALLDIAATDPVALDAVDRFAGRGFVAADADLYAPVAALIAPPQAPPANR
jgi:phosphonate transport system substrate-binding protein